ncbi:hypothetical protein LN042_07530 [Kitasatospora sp. RB6PN24]|uniref:hypothetical protein n=1 Tax=Kitasatospora humi TaxID=2893891 RepID=UPI001E3E5CCB|nr:hypothetical protein [Kitasatospora humi]MCC9306958.1 hypothetical protein [Kitasatospora humi]
MEDLAAPVPQPATGLPLVGALLRLDHFPCTGCGKLDAPFRGELRTVRVPPCAVRDERVWRCADCQLQHVAEQMEDR